MKNSIESLVEKKKKKPLPPCVEKSVPHVSDTGKGTVASSHESAARNS